MAHLGQKQSGFVLVQIMMIGTAVMLLCLTMMQSTLLHLRSFHAYQRAMKSNAQNMALLTYHEAQLNEQQKMTPEIKFIDFVPDTLMHGENQGVYFYEIRLQLKDLDSEPTTLISTYALRRHHINSVTLQPESDFAPAQQYPFQGQLLCPPLRARHPNSHYQFVYYTLRQEQDSVLACVDDGTVIRSPSFKIEVAKLMAYPALRQDFLVLAVADPKPMIKVYSAYNGRLLRERLLDVEQCINQYMDAPLSAINFLEQPYPADPKISLMWQGCMFYGKIEIDKVRLGRRTLTVK